MSMAMFKFANCKRWSDFVDVLKSPVVDDLIGKRLTFSPHGKPPFFLVSAASQQQEQEAAAVAHGHGHGMPARTYIGCSLWTMIEVMYNTYHINIIVI